MIQELIYTSAKSGLKPGSRGYCTVASSAGMSKPMSEKLESLSGYRHLFPPGTIQADNNPIAYSYVRTQIGGQAAFVLSRVADAGLDYSGRSNKLAHHVVLEQADLIPAGPAACLSDSRFAVKNWSGDPRVLPPRATPELATLEPMSRQGWKSAASDSLWCDFLIQQVRKRKPVYIVYPLEVDVLALLLEAQSLLPEDERWQMTFSTYFTRIPPGVECLVRCLPAGTKEAKSILGRHDQPKIDLSNPTAAPDVTPITEVPETTSDTASFIDTNPVANSDTDLLDDFDDVRVAPPELPSEAGGPNIKATKRKNRKQSFSLWAVILLGVALGGGIFAFILNQNTTPTAPLEQTAQRESQQTPPVEETSEPQNENYEATPPAETPSAEETPPPTPTEEPTSTDAAIPNSNPPTNPPPTTTTTPPTKNRKPVHWILGQEPSTPVPAKQIGDIQVRPLTSACKVEPPIEEGGEWVIKGADDLGFLDEIYFRAFIDSATNTLQITKVSTKPNPKLAQQTFSILIDDDREVFVHSAAAKVFRVQGFDGTTSREIKLKDVIIPPTATIQCAAQVTVNSKVTKSTPQLQTDPLSAWVKVSDDYAYLMELDTKNRIATLEPYALHGEPKEPIRLTELLKSEEKTRPLQLAVSDCNDMLSELKTIFETHDKPDLKKEFSEKQQETIRKAAQQILRDIRLIEKGEKQFKIRKHLQAGRAAGVSLLHLENAKTDLRKIKESTIDSLKQFEEFLKQTKKEWLKDPSFDRTVNETVTKVKKLSGIKLDVVLYKSREFGGRFPFLRFVTTEEESE